MNIRVLYARLREADELSERTLEIHNSEFSDLLRDMELREARYRVLFEIAAKAAPELLGAIDVLTDGAIRQSRLRITRAAVGDAP